MKLNHLIAALQILILGKLFEMSRRLGQGDSVLAKIKMWCPLFKKRGVCYGEKTKSEA